MNQQLIDALNDLTGAVTDMTNAYQAGTSGGSGGGGKGGIGNAANSLAGFEQGISQLGSTMSGVMLSITDAVAQLTGSFMGFVELADPAAVFKFTLAWRDLQAVIGRIFLPLLRRLTDTVRYLADLIAGLDSRSKELASMATVMMTVITGLAIVAYLFREVMKALTPLRVILFVIAGAIAAAVSAMEGSGLGDALGQLMAAFGLLAREIMAALMPVFVALTPLLEALAELVATNVTWLAAFLEPLGQLAAMLVSELTPYLVAFIQTWARFMEVMLESINKLRQTLGYSALTVPTGEARGDSVGAAVRPARSGTIDDLGRQNMISAFQAARGEQLSPEAQETRKLRDDVKGMTAEVGKKITEEVNKIQKTLKPLEALKGRV